MKRALITGVTGQDGSYLAELLLEKGYEVHGVIRRSSTFNTSRIDHLYKDPHESDNRFHLHYGDITDGVGISNLVRDLEPHEIYNLAAQSHVKVSFEMPDFTAQVDAVGTIRLRQKLILSFIKLRPLNSSEVPPHHNQRSLNLRHKVHMQQQNFIRTGLLEIIEMLMVFMPPMGFFSIMNHLDGEKHSLHVR